MRRFLPDGQAVVAFCGLLAAVIAAINFLRFCFSETRPELDLQFAIVFPFAVSIAGGWLAHANLAGKAALCIAAVMSPFLCVAYLVHLCFSGFSFG